MRPSLSQLSISKRTGAYVELLTAPQVGLPCYHLHRTIRSYWAGWLEPAASNKPALRQWYVIKNCRRLRAADLLPNLTRQLP